VGTVLLYRAWMQRTDGRNNRDQEGWQIMDTYPDKSLEQEYDDAERAAIARADERLDDEKNRIQEDE